MGQLPKLELKVASRSRAPPKAYAMDTGLRSALLEAMEALDLRQGLILTDSTARQDEIGGRIVRHQPLWQWLLQEPEPELEPALAPALSE